MKTSSTKMLYHMKQANRLKTKGASEAGHAQHKTYMGHINSIQSHKKAMGATSRKLLNHVSTSGRSRGSVAGGMHATVSRMRNY